MARLHDPLDSLTPEARSVYDTIAATRGAPDVPLPDGVSPAF